MRFHKARLYRKSTAPQTASCRPRQHSQYLTAWLVRGFFGATHSVACAAAKNEPSQTQRLTAFQTHGKVRRTGSNVAYKYKAAAGPCKRNFVPLGSRGAAPACFLLLRFLYTSKENAVAYSETGHSSSFIIIPSGRAAQIKTLIICMSIKPINCFIKGI